MKYLGGILMFATNSLLYLNQSVPTYGVSLSTVTKGTTSFPLRKSLVLQALLLYIYTRTFISDKYHFLYLHVQPFKYLTSGLWVFSQHIVSSIHRTSRGHCYYSWFCQWNIHIKRQSGNFVERRRNVRAQKQLNNKFEILNLCEVIIIKNKNSC